jgi:putative transcriptional regulator
MRARRSSDHPGRAWISQGSLGQAREGEERRLPRGLFLLAAPGRVYMAAIYAKSRKATLTAADRHVLAKARGRNQEGGEGRAIKMGVRTTDNGTKGRTKFGLEVEQSAKEILAHVKGEAKLPTRRIVLPNEVDVKRIRTRARMSQAEFARAFCINPRTLQEWEQGRRKPDATTRAYLAVIAKNREAVLEALAG